MAGSAANETPASGVNYWMNVRRFLAMLLARPFNDWTLRSRIKADSAHLQAGLAEPLLQHLTDDKLCRRKATRRE